MQLLRVTLRLVFFVEEAFIAAGLFVAILLEVAGVFFRYVLQRPFTWSEEFLTFLFVWMVFIGCSIAVRKREHIHVDVLVRLFSPSTQRAIGIFASIAFASFIALLGWTGLQTVFLQIHTGEVSSAMEMPMWLISLAVPVGCLLMLLSLVFGPERGHSPMESTE